MTTWLANHRCYTLWMICAICCSGCGQPDESQNDSVAGVQQVEFTPNGEAVELSSEEQGPALAGPTLAPAETELTPELAPAEQVPLAEELVQQPLTANPDQVASLPQIVPLVTDLPSANQPSQSSEQSTQHSSTTNRDRELPDQWARAFEQRTTSQTPGLSEREIMSLAQPSTPDGELQAAATRAQQFTARGARLVERGAMYSARQEFLLALQAVADGLDRQRQSDAHRRALQAGLTALDEIEDLIPRQPEEVIAVTERVAGHQTPVLQGHDLSQVSASNALQRYLAFAHQQLSTAAGDVLPAADALFALGKSHLIAAQQNSNERIVAQERATTLFQAALVVEPKHALAANELGVIYARQGKLELSKMALQHSASLAAHPSTWKNLVAVHQQLGETQLANMAQREQQVSNERWQKQHQARGVLANGAIQVVDQTNFARSAPANTYDQRGAAVAGSATSTPAPVERSTPATQPNPTPYQAQAPRINPAWSGQR